MNAKHKSALKLVKQLSQRAADPFSGTHTKLLAAASRTILELILSNCNDPAVLDVPDGPGWWWLWDTAEVPGGWAAVYVGRVTTYPPGKVTLHWYFPGKNDARKIYTGHWIRIRLPEPPEDTKDASRK